MENRGILQQRRGKGRVGPCGRRDGGQRLLLLALRLEVLQEVCQERRPPGLQGVLRCNVPRVQREELGIGREERVNQLVVRIGQGVQRSLKRLIVAIGGDRGVDGGQRGRVQHAGVDQLL